METKQVQDWKNKRARQEEILRYPEINIIPQETSDKTFTGYKTGSNKTNTFLNEILCPSIFCLFFLLNIFKTILLILLISLK